MTSFLGKKKLFSFLFRFILVSFSISFYTVYADTGDLSAVEEEPFDDEFFLDEYEDDKKESIQIADPLEPLNRAIFKFNDKLYFWVLKPVASGYKAIVPETVRSKIQNFFYNIVAPVRILNALFQRKWKGSGVELTRFALNSTIGILGFFDPATHAFNLGTYEEDFGQTLGTYGIGKGIYLVLPLFGPSTLRDTTGMVADYFMNPVQLFEETDQYIAITIKTINSTSFQLGQYETTKQSALDPYLSFRDIYLQYREEKISK